MPKTYLVTGGTGFIWYHLCKTLLEGGNTVISYDAEKSGDAYQDTRKSILKWYKNCSIIEWYLENRKQLEAVFQDFKIDKVCHLAAKPGVRNKWKYNDQYFKSNVEWFFNILDLSKDYSISNFVFASSSSIYGANSKIPFAIEDKSDTPVSFYAATKKSNELFAHSYAHLYKMPITGLRFFTVYWELGRHDMMMDIFCKKILAWESIDVHNHGKMKRDFTHVNDIIRGIILALDTPRKYEIFNLWNDAPVTLEYMIKLIESNLWKKAEKNYKEMESSEVVDTWADIEYTRKILKWEPQISIEDGVKDTVEAYKKYHNI